MDSMVVASDTIFILISDIEMKSLAQMSHHRPRKYRHAFKCYEYTFSKQVLLVCVAMERDQWASSSHTLDSASQSKLFTF